MKVLAAILMFVTLGVVARAQTPVVAPVPEAKVIAEVAARGNKGVKNSPFSADAISESVQTLADGNRITRSSTSKLYRNSEGRFRQEFVSGTGGFFGSAFAMGDAVTVINPGQSRFYLDSSARIAHVYDELNSQGFAVAAPMAVRTLEPLKTIEMSQLAPEARVELERAKAELDKFKANKDEFKAAADEMKVAAEKYATTVVGVGQGFGAGFAGTRTPMPKWDSRSEDLGEQNIEGVSAHGTRTITTIPAGAIGNERPIEITYEKWFSNELQMVVYSKQSDPRTGEQTYRLTNINRSEPDPSLFQLPSGYKVVSGGTGATYTYSTSKAQTVERASTTKPATAQGGTRVKNQN